MRRFDSVAVDDRIADQRVLHTIKQVVASGNVTPLVDEMMGAEEEQFCTTMERLLPLLRKELRLNADSIRQTTEQVMKRALTVGRLGTPGTIPEAVWLTARLCKDFADNPEHEKWVWGQMERALGTSLIDGTTVEYFLARSHDDFRETTAKNIRDIRLPQWCTNHLTASELVERLQMEPMYALHWLIMGRSNQGQASTISDAWRPFVGHIVNALRQNPEVLAPQIAILVGEHVGVGTEVQDEFGQRRPDVTLQARINRDRVRALFRQDDQLQTVLDHLRNANHIPPNVANDLCDTVRQVQQDAETWWREEFGGAAPRPE